MHKVSYALGTGGLAGLLVLQSALAGQTLTEGEVPPTVVVAFKAAYPNATNIQYEREIEHGATVYEVEFTFEGKKWEVEYSPTGQVLKTEPED